jgi:hypothetical protein
MSLYIKKLMEEVAREAAAEPQPSHIHKRLERWYNNLPPVARNRPYAMSELEEALKVPGRFLSAVLIEAGWTRKRRWEGTAHYYRYWDPPGIRAQGAQRSRLSKAKADLETERER